MITGKIADPVLDLNVLEKTAEAAFVGACQFGSRRVRNVDDSDSLIGKRSNISIVAIAPNIPVTVVSRERVQATHHAYVGCGGGWNRRRVLRAILRIAARFIVVGARVQRRVEPCQHEADRCRSGCDW